MPVLGAEIFTALGKCTRLEATTLLHGCVSWKAGTDIAMTKRRPNTLIKVWLGTGFRRSFAAS